MNKVYFRQKGIRARILAIAAITALALTGISGMIVSEKIAVLNKTSMLRQTANLFGDISHLLEELRNERGLSVLHASVKSESSFNNLKEQRLKTDATWEVLRKELVDIKDSDFDKAFIDKLTVTISLLTFLENVRTTIDTPEKTDVKEFSFFFSKITLSLHELMNQFIKVSPSPEVARFSISYTTLISAIENFSLQRDLGTQLHFEQGKRKSLKTKLFQLQGKEDTLLDISRANSPSESNILVQALNSEFAKAWYDMRSNLTKNKKLPEVKNWYETSNSFLSDLVAAQEQALSVLLYTTSQIRKEARFELIMVTVILAIFTLLFALLMLTMFDIANPILSLSKIMSELAQGNTNVEVEGKDRKDEIGALAQAVEVFKKHLIEREKVMQNLVEAKTAAEEGARVKAEFLATMSHEIRTPMNGIIGMTNLALDNPMDDDTKSLVKTIRECGANLLTIINDILDFSKIEAGKLEFENQPLNLYKSIDDTIALLSSRADDKGLKILSKIDSDVPQYINCDVTRIKQIILNLAGNAIKFTEKGHVAIYLRYLGEHNGQHKIECSIEDTGIGIKEENKNRLFKSFSQADGSTTRKYGGTGLGLVISKRLAEAMGGVMWMDSTFGEGSQFHFHFLCGKATKGQVTEEDSQLESLDKEMAKQHPLRILIAEDNKVNQSLALRLLKKMGYDAEIANHGREAVEAVAEKKYDVILMDMQMPEMDGIEATEIIVRDYSENERPHIIAMTANAMVEDRERCFAAGMSDYVAKPINFTELSNALAKAPSNGHSFSGQFTNTDDDEKLQTSNNADSLTINFSEVLVQFADDEELLASTIEIYLQSCDEYIENIKSAISNQSAEELRASAHTFKGTVSYFLLKRPIELAQSLEYMGKDGTTEGAEVIFEELVSTSKSINLQLTQFLSKAA